MKITLFATVSMMAVVGLAVADEMFNNWNNDDGFGGFHGGISGISGGISGGIGGGYSSGGYAPSYGAGYGSMGYGSMGYGKGSYGAAGYGYGSGSAGQVAYVPAPAPAQAGGSFGLTSILPIFFLLFLLPQLFNQSGSQDQILLINSTLEG